MGAQGSSVEVSRRGARRVHNLLLPALSGGSPSHTRPSLRPKREAKQRWHLCCPEEGLCISHVPALSLTVQNRTF